MSSGLDPEVLQGFLEEARGYLPALESELESLCQTPGDAASLAELYRLAHSIRSAGEMVGLRELAQTASAMEDLLAAAEPDSAAGDENLISLLQSGLDGMKACLASSDSGGAGQDEELEQEIQPEEIPGDLLDSFLEEAEEHLQSLGERLRDAEAHKERRLPVLREVRRSVHTIKGAAGMVGLNTISKVAHRMEDLLDLLYEGQAAYTPERHLLLTSTYDALCDLVSARGAAAPFQSRTKQLFAEYDRLLRADADNPPEEPAWMAAAAPEADAQPVPEIELPASAVADEPAADPSMFVRVPLKRLDELVRMVGELFVNSSVFEQQLDGYRHEVDELALNLARMRRICSSLETRHATFEPGLAEADSTEDARHAEFDALEFDRYTQLHLLSRDLNEATSDLATVGNQLNLVTSGFSGILSREVCLSGEIQDKLMRLRMAPLASIANRLHRTVRVCAQKRGKLAELALEGTAIELDKTVMEQLAGPLEHLLRNAVDHGIEEPAVRRALRKPQRGFLSISAAYEGTEAVIRLSDDGAGLDLARIRSRAVELGYYSEAEAKRADPDRLFRLVFEPGFSTADGISDISGRGVGLDVVKAGVEALEGTLRMESRAGQGVVFTIRLPMTLAITKVLMVEIQRERYAIPLAAVTSVARIEPRQIELAGKTRLLRLDDRLLPLLDLGEAIGLPERQELPWTRHPLVVVRAGEDEVAMLVDRIVEAREVVVKPLAGLLRRVPRMTGAAILGDGSVVLILNPAELSPSRREETPVPVPRRAAEQRNVIRVLIVDDSPSVRRAVTNLVRDTGWVPIQAKDGVDALEVLQRSDRPPDAILMDIEMPRMDGFELTSALRAQAAFRDTPIIMLTSRAGEKHRRKALDAGANEYLVKPYQDEALLAVIRRYVQQTHQAGQVA